MGIAAPVGASVNRAHSLAARGGTPRCTESGEARDGSPLECSGDFHHGLLAAAVLLAAILAGGPGLATLSAQDQYVLVVSGASGGAAFRQKHAQWRTALVTALRNRPGFDETRLIVLAETPGPGVGRASRAGIRQAVDQLAGRMGDDAVLYVVLIGHGSFDGVDAKFNLVGPDLEAGEWDRWLGALPGRLVFVNTSSTSFPFLRRLSAPGRTIVTATESAVQRYDTVFPQFFIDSLTDAAADEDKDGRVSVLEAFEFASFGVRQWYRQRGRLATERALIDDNGDGRGREAGQPGPDGPAAARLHVGAGSGEPLAAVTDPAVASLMARRAALEDAVHELKAARPRMPEAAYLDDLERTLIDLARVSRQIRRLAPNHQDSCSPCTVQPATPR